MYIIYRKLSLLLFFCFLALYVGCSQSGDDDDPTVECEDDKGCAADEYCAPTNKCEKKNPPGAEITWSTPMQVDLDGAGLQLDLKVTPDNQFAIAYYKRNPEIGECERPILGGGSTKVIIDTLAYARFNGTSWQQQDVIDIETAMLTGIALAFRDNDPSIAYLGGVEGLQICGGTDLILNRGPTNWVESVVVAGSGEAAAGDDCSKGQNFCNFGDVVGLWPSMAVSSDGSITGVLYRDIHNGYTQDANRFADLEYAYNSGGGWQHEWVDLCRGAGNYNDLVFDSQNEPIAVYYNGPNGSLHFAKLPWRDWTLWTEENTCMTDSECVPPDVCVGDRCSKVITRFSTGLDHKGVSLAIGQDGRYLVAYHDPDTKNLMIAHSEDGISWQKGLIDANGVTGMYPSLFIEPKDNQPQIVYYRCNKYPPTGSGCHDDFDGVHFAYFTGTYPTELTDPTKWKKSVVSDDHGAMDGAQASAVVLPDGKVGIAYLYAWIDPADNKVKEHLMFQLGEWKTE